MSNAPRSSAGRKNWGDDDSLTPILHIDMDSFFASVELAVQPQLRGKPLIVGGTGNRGVVTSCTYDVRAMGVRAGMPISQARALAPRAVVVGGQHRLYREYSRKIMSLISEISAVYEPISIDEAFLDVSGATRRLGSALKIAGILRQQIRRQVGLPSSVGIGQTKTVAKIASSNAKPDGILLIPASKTVEFLHSLPVGALPGVGKRSVELMNRWGIETVNQLAVVQLPELIRLLGEANARYLHAISWGEDNRQVGATSGEKSISTEETFESNLVAPVKIETFLLQAAHSCAFRLRKANLAAWTVQIKLRDAEFRTITRSVTLGAPSDLGKEIGQAAVNLFRKEHLARGGYRLLGVGVHGLVSREDGVQIALDDDLRTLAAERAMDAVKRKFGFGALGPATLLRAENTPNGRLRRSTPKMEE